jgi:hypothetical protein
MKIELYAWIKLKKSDLNGCELKIQPKLLLIDCLSPITKKLVIEQMYN